MNIFALITARGGSKGLPGKNIRAFCGRPLIAWSIDAALNSSYLDQVIVSTDDREIAKVSRRNGADVPFIRPAELAEDTTPHFDVVDHALKNLTDANSIDYILLLQPTSPLRTSEDIDAVIDLAVKKNADAVVSVCDVDQHPYHMYQQTEDGMLTAFMPEIKGYLRRQDIPPLYVVNGAIYLVKTDIFLKEKSFIPPKTIPYIMPFTRSIDIDNLSDFNLAEMVKKEAFLP